MDGKHQLYHVTMSSQVVKETILTESFALDGQSAKVTDRWSVWMEVGKTILVRWSKDADEQADFPWDEHGDKPIFLNDFLVGGLEHFFQYNIDWEESSQLNELIYFRGVGIPPTRIINHPYWNMPPIKMVIFGDCLWLIYPHQKAIKMTSSWPWWFFSNGFSLVDCFR